MAKRSPQPPAPKAYDSDLAYIHDAGFGGFATAAAAFLIDHLQRQNIASAKVVELGCGSGIQAAAVTRAGYQVLGFDLSPAMVALARERVPQGNFRVASFLDVEIPPCTVVTAVGEIFNYLFDERNSLASHTGVFQGAYRALEPGGWLLFDVALVGRIPEGTRRTYSEGSDWACLYEGSEDRRKKALTRQITSFRKVGQTYQRDCETHRLRLYEREELLAPLRKIGFTVRTLRGYGDFAFPPGYLGFLCTKPRSAKR